MTLQTGGKRSFVSVALATAALAAMLAFTGTPPAFAHDRDDYRCERRIAKADYKLHVAIERHGWYSRQANHARHELHEARERCWNERHRWWDEDGHRWHNDRDWNDHDRY